MERRPLMCESEPELFFSENPTEVAEAKAACLGCPRLLTCREQGASEPWGVFGGTDPDDRGTAYVPETQAELRAVRRVQILALAEREPDLGPREIGRIIGVDHSTVRYVLSSIAA